MGSEAKTWALTLVIPLSTYCTPEVVWLLSALVLNAGRGAQPANLPTTVIPPRRTLAMFLSWHVGLRTCNFAQDVVSVLSCLCC